MDDFSRVIIPSDSKGSKAIPSGQMEFDPISEIIRGIGFGSRSDTGRQGPASQ